MFYNLGASEWFWILKARKCRKVRENLSSCTALWVHLRIWAINLHGNLLLVLKVAIKDIRRFIFAEQQQGGRMKKFGNKQRDADSVEMNKRLEIIIRLFLRESGNKMKWNMKMEFVNDLGFLLVFVLRLFFRWCSWNLPMAMKLFVLLAATRRNRWGLVGNMLSMFVQTCWRNLTKSELLSHQTQLLSLSDFFELDQNKK